MSISSKKTILFLILSLFLGFGYSQIPKIKLAKKVPLNSEKDPAKFCFNSITIDNTGRLWMRPCSVAEQLYGMYVVQFDGHDRWPIPVKQQDWTAGLRSNIEGVSKAGFLYGFFNQSTENATLYTFDIASNTAHHTPVENAIIGGIEEYETGKFWVLCKTKDAFEIAHWDGVNLELYATIPNTTHYDTKYQQFAHPGFVNFHLNGNTLWFLDARLPLFSFHIPSKTTKRYEVDAFPGFTTDSTILLKSINTKTSLIVKDSQVYMLNNPLSPNFYHLDLRKQTDRFAPFIFQSEAISGESIWQDEVGNLLFVYNDLQQKEKAILLDNTNTIYDYTEITSTLPSTQFAYSKDFKKYAYFGTSNGAYYIQTYPQSTIKTYKTDKGLRHIGQEGTGDILIRAFSNVIKLKDDVITKLPKKNCLNASIPDNGPKEIMTDPTTGNAWMKTLNHLNRYTPEPDGSCFAIPFGMDAQRAVFLPNGQLVLMKNPSREIFILDLETQKTRPIGKLSRAINGVLHDLWASSNELLWIATNDGLYKVNLSNGQVQHYGHSPDFEDHSILVIHEATDDLLWLGTVSRGIHIFDPQKEEVIRVISEADGLSNNIVVGILEDDEGDIWAATYNGITIIQKDGEIMAVLNESDGLIHHEFNRLSSFKSQTGQLYFGSLAGLNEINPQKVKQQLKASEKTKIYISRLSYFDEESKQTLNIRNFQPNSSPLNLPAEQRFLSVKLGMSNYGEMARSRYAYRLNGLQKDWNYMGSEHLIRLPNLPSGKYILEIAGIDHKGNWTSNTIQIPIRAEEYFYKQAWFYMLCAIPFLIFAFLWIRRLRSEKYRLEQEVDRRTLEIRQDKELIQQQASELQQLDQMKSRFFANISHDLRTPITLISGPAELLAEEDYVKEKSAFHKAVVTIGKNSKKLLRLIDEILDLARLESKTVKLHEEIIPVVEFTQSIFDAYSLEAQHKKLQFELIAEIEEQMELLVDPNRLEKILNNLLSNALKFTAPGDNIQLRISKKQEQVIFEVADTGRGIPAEDLPHVFERFFQSKNQNLVQTSGSGIGLSLCQDFAKLMKGSLTVNSTFGQGSTFRLSLPVKQGQATSTWKPSPTANIQASINPKSVKDSTITLSSSKAKMPKLMIVEDNVEVQGFLQQLLATNYEVITFDNGQEALDFLMANKNKSLAVDLILSDINMPRLDGYGLIEALKKEEQWQQIPLIMLTARTKERSKLQALRMGVDDYLTKPFSPIELKVRIENILGNYQKRLAFQKDHIKVNPHFESSLSADQVWLKELETHALDALEKRIDLTAGHLAVQQNIGERQLARKVKLLTGLTIGKYITEVKLQKARHLVEERSYSTIAEIGYASGFRSPSYFTKVFTDHFGKTPTAYQ